MIAPRCCLVDWSSTSALQTQSCSANFALTSSLEAASSAFAFCWLHAMSENPRYQDHLPLSGSEQNSCSRMLKTEVLNQNGYGSLHN
eukprot:6481640-Amphidinium_carterae.1